MTRAGITEGRPTLEDGLRAVVQDEAQRNNGALPVKVVVHNKERNSVDVQPVIRSVVNGAAVVLPRAFDVPIRWLSNSAGASITIPLPPGSQGWITPAGGDTSAWFAHGTESASDVEHSQFDLSDSIFEPGSRPFTDPLPASAYSDTDMVLAGPVQVGSSAATELVALASLVIARLAAFGEIYDAHTHNAPSGGGTTSGPVPLLPETFPEDVNATKLRSE
jgi:hypothetical protein